MSIPYWGETNHDEFLSLMAQVFKNVTAADFAFYKKTVNGIQHLGGAFEHNFGPGGPEFKQTNLHSWKFSRVRDVKLWIDWHIMWKW